MINEALRLIRVFHDRSLSDLSKEIGVSQSYLSEIENGKKKPTLDVIEKYAKFFETTPSVIMYFSEDMDSLSKTKNKNVKIRHILIKFLKAIEDAGSK